MTNERFESVVDEQFKRCKSTLYHKSNEYSSEEDRLHNFKCAGGYQNKDPKDALLGMMTKHLVSISDMCQDGKPHTLDLWNEKITDAINYLLLLKGLVVEEDDKKTAWLPLVQTNFVKDENNLTWEHKEVNNE